MHPTVRTRTLRRWYFLSLTLGLAVVVISRLFVLPDPGGDAPQWTTTTANVFDNLIATILTAMAVGALVPFLFPADDTAESIEVLDSASIAESIEEATQHARQWHVRARTANYFARHTLLELTQSALKSRRSIDIKMQVLDPEDEDLLRSYARMRSNHRGAAALWTVERVRLEIYASILQAALCVQDAPRLNVTVGLSSMNWVMSLDLSDEMALVTGQNKGEPGLLFRKASQFFGGWCDDFESAFAGCRQITPDDPGITRESARHPTADDLAAVRSFFQRMGLQSCSDDQTLGKVLAQARTADNYA